MNASEIRNKLSNKDFMENQKFEIIEEEDLKDGNCKMTIEMSQWFFDVIDKFAKKDNCTKEEFILNILKDFVIKCESEALISKPV